MVGVASVFLVHSCMNCGKSISSEVNGSDNSMV